MNLLKKYLDGDMEKDKMERLTTDLVYQQLDPVKKENWREVLRKEHGVERSKKASARLLSMPRLIAIAASVALLITFVLIFNNKIATPAHQELAQEYITKLPIAGDQSVIRSAEEEDELRLQANEAYVRGDYDTAIQDWESLIASGTATQYDRFYLGASYLRNEPGNPQKAVELLTQVEAAELQQEVNWVLSLAYLQLDDIASARPILERIVTEDAFMAAAAAQLLASLPAE
ncbi:MAG: hypothetical protein AAFR36_11335 [Bacteroidota bacterium]